MADTPIEFHTYENQTLTADLVAADDTLRASALPATELTNGVGDYRVSYTGSATGHHTLHIKDSADGLLFVADYYLQDTTEVHYPLTIAGALDQLFLLGPYWSQAGEAQIAGPVAANGHSPGAARADTQIAGPVAAGGQ